MRIMRFHGGSGAVGLAAVQLARHAGCTVVGTAGTEAGLAAIRAAGATAAVCHREEGYLQQALAALGGRKFSTVLEMAAHSNLIADLGVIATGGQLAIIGSKVDPVSLNPRLLMAPEISVMGVFLGTQSAEEKVAAHAALYAAMEAETLTPVIGMTLSLEEAPKAHTEVMTPSAGGKVGNIVLHLRDEAGACD